MTSLHDRLADLAEDAPAEPRPPDLWERGRRYGRRRRIESVAVAVLLLGAVGSLLGALLSPTSYDVSPADAETSLRLPDRIELPSPWARGTDETGPIGPVVAVFTADRRTGWFDRGHDRGLVAVSASGDYAYLDLPDAVLVPWEENGGVALSADGRWVAYALAGETRQEPNDGDGDAVAGVGVYDTVTGEVQRLYIPSAHGLAMEQLGWLGDSVRLVYGRYVAGSGGLSRGHQGYLWDIAQHPAAKVPTPHLRDVSGVTEDGRVVKSGGRRVRVLPGRTGAPPLDVQVDVLPGRGVALSGSGKLLALLVDDDGAAASDGTQQRLRVGTVPASGAGMVETRPVGDVEGWVLHGWRDDRHVVVEDLVLPGLNSVDVETGDVERLTDLPSYQGGRVEMIIAQDALQAPTFAAPGPPYVVDPRLRAALLVLASLLATLALVLWRRRGRL